MVSPRPTFGMGMKIIFPPPYRPYHHVLCNAHALNNVNDPGQFHGGRGLSTRVTHSTDPLGPNQKHASAPSKLNYQSGSGAPTRSVRLVMPCSAWKSMLTGCSSSYRTQHFCFTQGNWELQELLRGIKRRLELLGVPWQLATAVSDCCCHVANALDDVFPGAAVCLDAWHLLMRYAVLFHRDHSSDTGRTLAI